MFEIRQMLHDFEAYFHYVCPLGHKKIFFLLRTHFVFFLFLFASFNTLLILFYFHFPFCLVRNRAETLRQNYNRLGLLARLRGSTGGVEKRPAADADTRREEDEEDEQREPEEQQGEQGEQQQEEVAGEQQLQPQPLTQQQRQQQQNRQKEQQKKKRPATAAFSAAQESLAIKPTAHRRRALTAAAAANDTRVLLDVTQSCGWLPIDCSRIDYTVCAAYKWLLSPRGVAFMSVRPDRLEALTPHAAGWYAGQDVWSSLYGSPLRLSADARRFDTSPVWFSWVAAAPSLELLAALDLDAVHAHDVGLAERFLDRLGLPSQGSAIVTVDAAGAEERLAASGVRTAVRAGRVRASFHLYNTDEDVELAVSALTDGSFGGVPA